MMKNKKPCGYCINDNDCEDCKVGVQVFKDYDEFLTNKHKEQAEKDNKFLESINYLFAKRIKDFFDSKMEECGGYNFRLVKKPEGEKQSYYAIDYYVKQFTGYSGDDFSGTCYLRLANNEYLAWDYEC